MAGRRPGLNKCEKSLRRCEKRLATISDVLRDIDMKLNHVIERMKNQSNQVGLDYR
jgi:hypothetical protein